MNEQEWKEYIDKKVERFNNDEGELHLIDNINCPKCKNKGWIMFATQTELYYTDFTYECECMRTRRMYEVMQTSGLGDMLKQYRLNNFEHNEQWQDDIYNKATTFVNNPTNCFYIGGQVGCVDCDTEFFNGKEWKKISEYNENDLVLQYNENGIAELVKPLDYIKLPCNKLNYVKTKYGIDMCLSEEHNVVYVTSKGHLAKIKFSELKKRHNQSNQGFYGKFITTFRYGGKGIDLTDDEIKLYCAVICDGSYHYQIKKQSSKCYNKARFHIKKDRKKQELRELFKSGNFEWSEKKSVANGYTDFYVMTPYRLKTFTPDWYNCNTHQLKIICDNILKWDGCESNGRKRFSSRDKQVIDFIQFAFASQGYRTSIQVDNRIGRKRVVNNKVYIDKRVSYTLTISSNNKLVTMTGYRGHKVPIQDYQTKDGFKYCFTVPSHIWVMRRNGNIIVTGNSGKTHICTAIVGALVKRNITDVRFCVWDSIATILKQEAYSEVNSYNKRLNSLMNTEILFIDDFFKGNQSPADIKNAFTIINHRYNISRVNSNINYITIISSEKTIQEILDIDEAIGSRIVEMSKGYTISTLKDISKNYRLKY